MSAKIYSYEESRELLAGLPITHIRLISQSGHVIVPAPSKSATLEKRLAQIDNYMNSPVQPDGVYIIEHKSGSRSNMAQIYVRKGQANEAAPLSDEAPQIIIKQETETKTKVYSDREIIELEVENKRLQMENDILRAENEELKAEIEELNEIDELEDAPEPGSQFGWLKEILPPLADNFFQLQREKNEIEAAKLNLRFKEFEQIKSAQNGAIQRENKESGNPEADI